MTKSIDQAPTLIGLTGANGAGKDTAANLLAGLLASYNKPCTVLAFATALYEEVSTAYAISTNHLTNRARKEQPMYALALTHCADLNFVQAALEHAEGDIYTPRSPRQILQWWGTEYRRAQQPSYWVQRLQARLQERLDEGFSHCVITDVRFADEAAAIRAMGGQIWRIDRPNYTPSGTGHISEVTGQEFTPEATITNHGTLDALRLQLLQTLLRTSMKSKERATGTEANTATV